MPRIHFPHPFRATFIPALALAILSGFGSGSVSAQVPGSVNPSPTPPPSVSYVTFVDQAASLGNPGTEFDGPDVGRGVAWVDVVGHDSMDPSLPGPPDGILDLVVSNSNSPALPLGALPGMEDSPAIGSDPGPCNVYRGEADGTFTEIAALMGATGTGYDITYPGGSPFGVLAADFDDDGDHDLFYPCGGFNTSSVNGLLENDGDGTFTYVSSTAGMPENQVSFGGTWFDYDLDGDLDLYVTNAVDILEGFYNGPPNPDPTDRLFQNSGNGTFTEVGAQADVDLKSNGFAVIAADLDNDGWGDLTVACYKQYNKVFYNEGDGTFRFMAPPNNTSISMNIDTDMFQEESGAWELSFVPPNGLQIIPIGGHQTLPAEVADVNGDGWLDVLYGVWSSQLPDDDPTSGAGALYAAAQRQFLYLNAGDLDGDGRGEGLYREAGLGTGYNHVAGTMGLLVADFNLDGYPDIYVGNGGPDVDAQLEEDFLYMNNGPTWPDDILENLFYPLPQAFYEVGALAGTYSNTFMAHGLMLRNGANGPDIYVANGGPALHNQGQANVYYENQGASNGRAYRGIAIELQETESAPGSFGARVIVMRGNPGSGELLINLQERRSSHGFNSADLGPLVFGFGQAKQVFVQVDWPSGIRMGRSLYDIPTVDELLMVEPTLSMRSAPDTGGTNVLVDFDNRSASSVNGDLFLRELTLSSGRAAAKVGGNWVQPPHDWVVGPEQSLGPVAVGPSSMLQVSVPMPSSTTRTLFLLTLRNQSDGALLNQAVTWQGESVGLQVDPDAAGRLTRLAGLSPDHPWDGRLQPTPDNPGAALPALSTSRELTLEASRVSVRSPRAHGADTHELDGSGHLLLPGDVRLEWRLGRTRLLLPRGASAQVTRDPDDAGALTVFLGQPEACCDNTASRPQRILHFEDVCGTLRSDGRPHNTKLQPIGPRVAPRRMR